MKSVCILAAATLISLPAMAAEAGSPAVGKILDQQLNMAEHEVVSLAEAMPADKYGFAPTHGEFSGVRTFAQQMTHIATVIYATSASVLGDKPVEMGPGENGPANLKTKEQVVKYLKDSFAYGHKAMMSLTSANITELIVPAFGKGKAPRLSMATVPLWHSFDHYGQAVEYARMNGIVPPASR